LSPSGHPEQPFLAVSGRCAMQRARNDKKRSWESLHFVIQMAICPATRETSGFSSNKQFSTQYKADYDFFDYDFLTKEVA
jgi:hypothetical protein